MKDPRGRRARIVAVSCSIIGASLLGLMGCGSDDPIIDTTIDSIVYGTVTRASGGPVANATVAVRVFEAGCIGSLLTAESTSTTNNGAYRLRLGLFRGGEFCAEVVVDLLPGN